MAKKIPGVPESLTRAQFLAIFEAINVDPNETTDLRLAPNGISVTVVARTPNGQLAIDQNNSVIKHSVFIPVRDEDEEEGK